MVHGGAYAALAESMVSATTHLAVEGDGNFAVGQSNHTHFLRPATEGAVHAEGTPDPPRPHELGLGRPTSRTTRAGSAPPRA